MPKINFIKILTGYGVKALTGLAAWQAWLVNLLLNRVWNKQVYPMVKRLWVNILNTVRDNKDLKQYVDTVTKGKDADAKQELNDQLNLLNPTNPPNKRM
jgi:hypothetical protein